MGAFHRIAWFVVGVVCLVSFGLSRTDASDFKPLTQAQAKELRLVFPEADLFTAKEGALPHHKAYTRDAETGAPTLIGFVFETQEVQPDEMAYSSVVKARVGLTLDGTITRVEIIGHREPYGFISIDPPRFVKQLEGKSILEDFRVGRDIDAVSGATITLRGAARIIRKSARQIARQYLVEQQKTE